MADGAVVVTPGAILVAVAVVVVVATKGSAATSLQEAMLLLPWACSVSTRAALTTQVELQTLEVQHWLLAPSRVTWMSQPRMATMHLLMVNSQIPMDHPSSPMGERGNLTLLMPQQKLPPFVFSAAVPSGFATLQGVVWQLGYLDQPRVFAPVGPSRSVPPSWCPPPWLPEFQTQKTAIDDVCRR